MLTLRELPNYDIKFKSIEFNQRKTLSNIPCIYMVYNKLLDKVVYVGYSSQLKKVCSVKLLPMCNPVNDYVIYYVQCLEGMQTLKDVKRELRKIYYEYDN